MEIRKFFLDIFKGVPREDYEILTNKTVETQRELSRVMDEIVRINKIFKRCQS